MFCTTCGKEIPNGAKFCSYCGATQNSDDTQLAQTNSSTPDVTSIVNDVDNAYGYAKSAGEYYAKYVEAQNQNEGTYDDLKARRLELNRSLARAKGNEKAAINQQISQIDNYLDSFADRKTVKRISNFKPIRKVMLGFAIAFFLFSTMAINIRGGQTAAYVSYMLHVLSLVGTVIVSLRINKLTKQKESQAQNALTEHLNNVEATANAAYNDACNVIRQYKADYGVIPEKYLNTYALDYIRETLVNLRAASLREAINLFEMYEQQQEALRANDARYQELLAQQEAIIQNQNNMFREYNKDRAVDGAFEALAWASLMFK